MVQQMFRVIDKGGIAARPAALILKTAEKFASKITMEANDMSCNAKSLLGLFTIGACYGTNIRVSADGPDEKEAVHAIGQLAIGQLAIGQLVDETYGKLFSPIGSEPNSDEL